MDWTPHQPAPVLVVDDHPGYRAVMREVVQATAGLSVAGEADSGEAAIEVLERLAVRLVIMDKRMPGMGGLAACQIITERYRNTAVIVCSVEDSSFDRARSYGARAVIRKQDLSPAKLQDILASLA